jgi:predicted protein tyrosine phosphatase
MAMVLDMATEMALAAEMATAMALETAWVRLEFQDIRIEHYKINAPSFSASHAKDLLKFGKEISGPILVHCAWGLSRSPGCAFLLAAQAYGPGYEDEAANAIKSYGTRLGCPNSIIVRIGDEILARNGALKQAWEKKWNDGKSFSWDVIRL